MPDPFIPWWTPAAPAAPTPPPTSWRDVWDAIFGPREFFVKISLHGSSCICELRGIADFVDPKSEDRYEIEVVTMTRRQFERLPEFGGF